MLKSAFIAFVAVVLAGAAAADERLILNGSGGQVLSLSQAEFAALPHETLTLTQEGKTHRWEGVPLTVLLAKVGAPVGKDLRGPALANAVVVTASDGYRVVLALAETDALMRAQHILVADRADGAPLDAATGPFRLVVEGDLRAARSARQIVAIRIWAVPPAPGDPALAPTHH